MMRLFLWSPVLILCGLLSLFNPVYADELKIAGSTTINPLMQEIAQAYMSENKDVRVSISAVGSGQGIKLLLDNQVEMAMSSRYLNEKEIQQAAGMGIQLVPFRIAYDSIIPIVHRSNPVKNLSTRQLQKIYSGQLRNWKELNGQDSKIHVISRENTSGTYAVWNEKIMVGKPLSGNATIEQSSLEVLKVISSDPSAIGYVGIGFLNPYIKPLSIDGINGSTSTTLNGEYSLGRPLFVFTRGWPKNSVIDFINFATHPRHGQDLAKEAGFVTLY